jgi:hypothetical protein
VSTAEAAGYEAEARERAENFLSAVRADGDAFGILVKAQGDPCTVPRFDAYPIDLRERGGELARLRADHFGGVLNEPVGKASGGDLLGPIATPSGFWVVRVIGRTPVPFETVAGGAPFPGANRTPAAHPVSRGSSNSGLADRRNRGHPVGFVGHRRNHGGERV